MRIFQGQHVASTWTTNCELKATSYRFSKAAKLERKLPEPARGVRINMFWTSAKVAVRQKRKLG